MSRRPLQRKLEQDEPEDTRAKLLQAAVHVFSERGYEGATVRNICQRAGVNLALVNYHFGDKLELYLAVIRYAVDAEAKMALLNHAVEQNADPCDALRQIIHGILERLCATARDRFGLLLRFMLKEMANPTPALGRLIEETIQPLYGRVRSLVGEILNLPMDHEKTRLCTHSIMGQVAHYSHAQPVMSQLWPEMKMSPEQRAMVANHIADFSLAYLRAARDGSPTPSKSPRKRK
jgi:TetR/AcrR family transcriptional regulator, regulator of cefoperazone and chloramphenicol sensitivity